jgi:hypothetical protein
MRDGLYASFFGFAEQTQNHLAVTGYDPTGMGSMNRISAAKLDKH